jgi:hypothetical protein
MIFSSSSHPTLPTVTINQWAQRKRAVIGWPRHGWRVFVMLLQETLLCTHSVIVRMTSRFPESGTCWIYEGVSKIFRTDAVNHLNVTTKRVWKLPTSTQLRAIWHTASLDMVVLPSTGDSRDHNCCIDGGTSPGYFGYTLVLDSHGRIRRRYCDVIVTSLLLHGSQLLGLSLIRTVSDLFSQLVDRGSLVLHNYRTK